MSEQTELSDEDRGRMLWARLPDKRNVQLVHTTALEAEYRAWQARECKHSSTPIVRLIASNGAPQFRRQCTDCGLGIGQWIKKSEVPHPDSVAEGDRYALSKYEHSRREEWNAVALRHLTKQDGRANAEYYAYLQSESWKAKRALVLARSNGKCEGCGVKNATQVHHLSYRNIYQEFLWELVAICDDCHDRVHADALEGMENADWEEDGD